MSDTATGRPLHTVFVGREHEVGELRVALADACAGRGWLFMLEGEPGIGKTRMADELASEARAQGARVLWGRCWEGEGAPAFWPWMQLIRAYARDRDPSGLRVDMGGGAADIAQVVPEIGERLPGLPAPQQLEPEQARFRLFDSVCSFLRTAATHQPLLLILDDLHWADTPSLLLLQFLAREVRAARLLVIGTYRDAGLTPDHPLSEVLGQLARDSRRIALRGLTAEDIVRFMADVGGQPPQQGLVTAVHALTDGNPFFVSEVVQLLKSEGRLAAADAAASWRMTIPHGVRQTIRRRLARLSPVTERVLHVASVMGREFALHVLEQVCRDADVCAAPAAAESAVLGWLDEAVVAGIVSPVSSAVGQYRLSHALIRETLYEDLSGVERSRLHLLTGEALERLHRPNADPHLAELAHHFSKAALSGGIEKALQYNIAAGRHASSRLAYEEAVGHYQRAIEAFTLRGVQDARQYCDLLLDLGEALLQSGDETAGFQQFASAAESARAQRLGEHLARAALLRATNAMTGGGDAALVALLEEGLAAVGQRDSALGARLLGKLADVSAWKRQQQRRTLCEQAVAMARRIGDRMTLADVLVSWHWTQWGPENLAERLAVATEIVDLGTALPDGRVALQGHGLRMVDLLELGDVRAADVEARVLERLAEEVRDPFQMWRPPLYKSLRAFLSGRFGDAEALAEEALARGQRVQSATAMQYFGAQLFALRREQGRLQEIAAAAAGLADAYPTNAGWRAALAFLYRELGQVEEARREFERLAANDFADVPRDFNWLIAVAFLGDVSAFLNDVARSEKLYELLAPYAHRAVVVAPGIACTGSVSYVLARLACTLRRFEAAARHFQDAIEMNARMGARAFLAHAQADYAALLLARNQPDHRPQAQRLLAEALATYDELGMRTFGDRARNLAGGAGLNGAPLSSPHPPPRETDADQSGNVFRKEGDYWTIRYNGTVLRLKDSKGLQYIARLLRDPGREFHVADLLAAIEEPQAGDSAGAQVTKTRSNGPRGARVSGLPDGKAKAAYRERLQQLHAELDEAERFNDLLRATSAREEIDCLTSELAGRYGVAGLERVSNQPIEQIRKAVTNRIHAALVKIRKETPPLARHLSNAIKTGTFCAYRPENPTPWAVD
jgi:tetratricopeptide (TPR) repeat protein